jgi:hypothetical protein
MEKHTDRIPYRLPAHARPLPPSPPPHRVTDIAYLQRVQDWVSSHRALTAAIVAFAGTGGFLLWRERRIYHRKRRARKINGAKSEVVGRRKRLIKSTATG